MQNVIFINQAEIKKSKDSDYFDYFALDGT